MTAVPTGEIRQKSANPYVWADVCGTCGAIVAPEHIARHIAWHAQAPAAAFPATVVNSVTPNRPGGNG
jgi:hypothetical protein